MTSQEHLDIPDTPPISNDLTKIKKSGEVSHYDNLPISTRQIQELVLDDLPSDVTSYEAHCIATALKYRLRAGYKDDITKDINKALDYEKYFKESVRNRNIEAHG